MSKTARRILFTLAVVFFAGLIVLAMLYGRQQRARTASSGAQNQGQTQHQPAPQTQPASSPAGDAPATQAASAPATQPGGGAVEAQGSQPSTSPAMTTQPAAAAAGLHAVAPDGEIAPGQPPQALGSVDPRRDLMRVRLSRFGAGVERIEFADIWQTALAKRQAHGYLRSLAPGQAIDETRLPSGERYVLVSRTPHKTTDPQTGRVLGYSGVPVLALRAAYVDNVEVDLLNDSAWAQTGPGTFETDVVDAQERPVLRIVRRYSLGANYDLTLEQRVINRSDGSHTVRLQHYGPVDLPDEPADYIKRHRFHFGTVPDPRGRPTLVLADDSQVIERSAALKQYHRSTEVGTPAQAAAESRLWPNDKSSSGGWALSWFGSTNRYFSLTIHPVISGGTPTAYVVSPAVATIDVGASGPSGAETVFTVIDSATLTIAAGQEQDLNLGVFAGPLDRDILNSGAYDALAMYGLIIYSMGSCCSFLTFQWLAHLLLWFLGFLHDYAFRDWALAIIGLVVVVRTLLHPLTKRSQVNMQRFGKKMQALKPELDKIQKKYAGDKQRLQQEQMRLWREHNVNPVTGALGCLPLFLQMPIWIALWASLYLAFDLRQQAAFYGLFQAFGGWAFLADLSSPDRFISLGSGFTLPLLGHIGSLNLLPILMAVVFFIQQKYLTPPTAATMTPEQRQQQVMMKWMMVILFPLMMYNTPSGLTLYIMTSSIIGILESRYIRRHIDEIDRAAQASGAAGAGGASGGAQGAGLFGERGPKKPKDALGRAWMQRLAAIREKQRQRQQERRSFKKRK